MPSSSLAFYSLCELICLCNCEMYKTIIAKSDVIKKSEKVRRIPSVNMPMVILLAKSVTCGKKS